MSNSLQTARRPTQLYDAYIFDLDGTVYLGDDLLPNAHRTITALRAAGKRTVFLSNNSTHTRFEYALKLTRLELPTPPEDIVNSAVVMVDFLRHTLPHAKLFVCGEQPLIDDLRDGGFSFSDDPLEIDVVIASFDHTFVYSKLQIAFDAIRAGARFFATNADRYCPVPGGGQPDAASIIAAIETCTGARCEAVVGKPSVYMTNAILHLLQLPPERCIMTGDRLETDVQMGLTAGMAAALTLTGVTTLRDAQASTVTPHFMLNDLGDLLPETAS